MIIVLIKLILAHLIGDFPLQPDRWVEAKENKRIKSWELYAHIALHGMLALLLLGDLKYWNVALSIALTSDVVIIYITAVFFLTQPMSIIMNKSLKNWSVSIQRKKNNSLTNAGKYIGMLERLFVFVLIVTSNWEAVGFLLAAKSIFRFGDLRKSKDRKLTEYVLIGTLVSFGTAIIIALITIRLVNS